MALGSLQPDQINRVVVRAPTWVGDAVMSLPALHELRRLLPRAHICIASPPGTADIFLDSKIVDEVLPQQQSGRLSVFANARDWRVRHFDLAVLFQNAFAAAATAFLARVPRRIGYATDRRGPFLTTSLPLPSWKDERHESFYYLNIIAELERTLFGTSTVNTAAPIFDLAVSENRKRNARASLGKHGAQMDKPLAILCPGSVNSRAKRWPAERYAALADQMIDEGIAVALIGSPGELEVSQEVVRLSRTPPVVMTGQTSVAEVVAIISIAEVLVTNDTGPAHIAAALQTPAVVIFGPTNPLTTYPLSPRAEIIRHPPDCAPCMFRDCPIDHRCMTAISTEEVLARSVARMGDRNIQLVE
jgi:heptosyltransferase II